jgi:dihydrofolate reductase
VCNTIYIATSIDGYIADKNDSTEFLECVSNPQNEDLGTFDFFDSVDCLLMGRNTYQTVLGFGGDWPYPMPVFVMSSSLKDVDEALKDNVQIVSGEVDDVLSDLRTMGYVNIYVDGGSIIKQFIFKDLIDEMIITTIPILLGGGTSLFGLLDESLEFDLIDSKVYLNQLVSTHYKRKRK